VSSEGKEPELRASDRDRDAVLETLAVAASDGRLTLEEYSARVDQALVSRLHGELSELTNDLERPLPARAGTSDQTMSAVLGSESRRGSWRVPTSLTLKSLLGDCSIELQEAVLSDHRTTIKAHATLGSITIYVPEGIDVRLSGSAILGSKTYELQGAPAPNAPIIEIEAHAFLGSITVRAPRGRHRIRAAIDAISS